MIIVFAQSLGELVKEYDLPAEEVQRIMNNQDWLRTRYSGKGGWPGDSWFLPKELRETVPIAS